jgi:hypothetical protein
MFAYSGKGFANLPDFGYVPLSRCVGRFE